MAAPRCGGFYFACLLMPKPPEFTPRQPPVMDGWVGTAWVGLLVFACLVMPGVLWLPHEKQQAPVESQAAGWLEFQGAEEAVPLFVAAPPLEVRVALGLAWPVATEEADSFSLAVGQGGRWLPSDVDPLRWLEGQIPAGGRATDSGRLHYHLVPSFGFENRELQLRGLTLRLWFNF